MLNNKTTGPDNIPVEAFKYYPRVQDLLFQIILTMWTQEEILDGLVYAKFVMLYEKGSANDPGNYRCMDLLNHVYKLLSQIMLDRLSAQCDSFLQD